MEQVEGGSTDELYCHFCQKASFHCRVLTAITRVNSFIRDRRGGQYTTHLDDATRAALVREIALTLAKKQRIAFASDFHAFAEGRKLTLAGVTFDAFPKGPNTTRSDGDVVAHAIVMALAAAVNKGDIDDWFPDKGETGVRSIDYLPEMHRRLIAADHLIISTVDVTILCGEQPRMKKRLPEMQHNIAEGLGVDLDQVHVKVSSMDGQDEIARLEGIEARVVVSLWEGL